MKTSLVVVLNWVVLVTDGSNGLNPVVVISTGDCGSDPTISTNDTQVVVLIVVSSRYHVFRWLGHGSDLVFVCLNNGRMCEGERSFIMWSYNNGFFSINRF